MGRIFRIAGGAAICAVGFIAACSADNGSQLSDDDARAVEPAHDLLRVQTLIG